MVWLVVSGHLSPVEQLFRCFVEGMRMSGDLHLEGCSLRDIQAWSAFDDHLVPKKQHCPSYEDQNAWVTVVAAVVLVVAVMQTEGLRVLKLLLDQN